MASIRTKRLQRELTALRSSAPPPGIGILNAEDFSTWHMSIQVIDNPLYTGQTFAVRFKFDDKYPIDAPEVVFTQFAPDGQRFTIPLHGHIYSNGHICLSILADGYSPALTVQSICLSLQSMLASNTKLERPEGDERYCRRAPSDARQTRWGFHDDTV